MAGARNLISRDYDNIKHEVLIDAVTHHFPLLLETLGRMIADLSGELTAEELPG